MRCLWLWEVQRAKCRNVQISQRPRGVQQMGEAGQEDPKEMGRQDVLPSML